jgi:Fe-S-cluster containining protein
MANSRKNNGTNGNGEPWFKDGLPFQCTACGDCCTGAPGYVWVNKEEIAALAAMVGMPAASFEDQYVLSTGTRKSLKEFPNGDCVFFDNKLRKCRVYTARPRQCRTWPFWNSNIRSPEAWAETCRVCPGSGTGRLYQLAEIEDQAKVIRI